VTNIHIRVRDIGKPRTGRSVDEHPRRGPAVTPNQIRHVALEQGGEAVLNHTAVTNVLRPRPPKPVFEWTAWLGFHVLVAVF
jgi:hypothetical protein